MAIDPRTSRFWQETLRSGLLDEDSLHACWEAIPEEKRDAEAIDRRMARQAISRGMLTLWQAQQVLAGRAMVLRIGKYVALDIIGRGGMGLVFLAQDTRLRRRVAIKVLSRERMSSPRALARFEREAKVGAQLQHDNLVRIYDEGEAKDLRYLVMEYIEGRNVSQILTDVGRLPPELAASIARQVCLGLEHARLKGLIHRDVNPQNILVTYDGVAKLADLGLAIDLGDPEDVVTRDGATVGTFDYISPEQARHPRSVDTRSDLYSLGCTLYHMIVGRVPFAAASLPEKLYAHQLQMPDPPSSLVPGVPPELDAIVMKMVAKSPDDRFPSPLAVAEALAPFARGAEAVAEILRPPPPEENRGPAPSQVAAPPENGSDPHSFRLGPEPDHRELPPTRTSSSLRPEKQAATLIEPGSDSDPGVGPGPGPDPDPGPGDGPALPVESATTEPEPEPEPPPRPARESPRPPVHNGLGLPIDLGPEPSLVETLSSSRSRSRSSVSRSDSGSNSTDRARASAPDDDDDDRPGRRQRSAMIGGAVLIVVLLGLLLYALFGPGGGTPDETVSQGNTPGQDQPEEPDPPPEPPPPTFKVGRADGTGLIDVASFQDALELAPNNGGTVYLGEMTEPIRIDADQNALLVPWDSIVIRPEPGTSAAVTVVLGGGEPWLRQTQGSLTLQDLTVTVRLEGPLGERPPLVVAEGSGLTLRRCSFLAESGIGQVARAADASARTVVEGCFFSGFERALDLRAYGTVSHEIRQSIFAWPQTSGDRPGWAVRITTRSSGQTGSARLTIDHCSILGAAGLVEARGLLADQPLQLQVADSAIRADHLLAWSPPTDNAPFPTGLQWTGSNNRYALQHPSYVVTSTQGPTVPEWSPKGFDSWVSSIGDSDQDDSSTTPIELADESALQSPSLDPAPFAARSGDEPIGADPAQVGPTPLPPPAPAEPQ